MKPAWTWTTWPPVGPLATVRQARNWVGVYGDSSVDDEISACLEAAEEKIAAFVGYRISDTAIADYFPAACGRRLELSEPGIDRATVAIKYYDADELEQTLDAADWSLDPTAERNIVTLDAVPALSRRARHPIRAEYTSKLINIRGAPAIGRLKLAVRMAVTFNWATRSETELWRTRGDLSADLAIDRALWSLLASCRLEPPVAA